MKGKDSTTELLLLLLLLSLVLFEAACGNLVIVSEGLNVGVYEKDKIHFTFDTGVAQPL